MAQKIRTWDIDDSYSPLKDEVENLIGLGHTIVSVVVTDTAEHFSSISKTQSQSLYFTTKALIIYNEKEA